MRIVLSWRERFEGARRLWNHIQTIGLPTCIVEYTGSLKFAERVRGLRTHVTFVDLASLVGNSQVWEDVINGWLELSYTRVVIHALDKPLNQHHVYSTQFIKDVELARCSTKESAPHEIKSARTSLIRTPGYEGFLLVAASKSHYTAYGYDKRNGSIRFLDTMRGDYNNNIITIIKHFISKYDLPFPEPSKPFNFTMNYQVEGSNSCGLAVLNYIERELGLTHVIWEDTETQKYRDRILRVLIAMHFYGSNQVDTVWWTDFDGERQEAGSKAQEATHGFVNWSTAVPTVR
jgi:hypothetical protein